MRATKEMTGENLAATCTKKDSARAGSHSSIMEGLMGAAKDAMGGGEAPPHDPAEAEAAINAEADKAGAAGNSDLMAKLKSAATNKKIQGAFMDVKNNGVSAAMKYKDDAECVSSVFIVSGSRRRRRCFAHRVTGILKDVFMS